MAKKKTGGLGRGLDALLGVSMYEANPDANPRDNEENPPVLNTDEVASEEPIREGETTDIPKDDVSDIEETSVSEADTSVLPAAPPAPKPIPQDIPKIYDNENSTVTYRSVKRPAAETAAPNNAGAKAVNEEPQETKRKPQALDEIPLDSIIPNPDQPRTNFKPEELEELASSIEKDGLLQPILVRPAGKDTYEIIAGERRWQACKKIGMKNVPVRIREADDTAALELALIENIQRSDLNPIEEAYGYRRIMERRKVTQSELAQMVSKGRSTIANALRLLDLPEDAQQLLYEEKITAGHARAILSIPSTEGKNQLTKKLVQEKLSVRETENLARLISGREKGKSSSTARVPSPKEFKMVARKLKTHLDANVKVKTVQGKNKIEIEFDDVADLERIYELIAAE